MYMYMYTYTLLLAVYSMCQGDGGGHHPRPVPAESPPLRPSSLPPHGGGRGSSLSGGEDGGLPH